MNLTSERCNGIKSGYWSAAKKEDLVQKLGRIEKNGPSFVTSGCVMLCAHKGPLNQHDPYCTDCPLKKLLLLLDGD